MVEALDHVMADGLDEESHLPLTEDEEKALALYDRLQELRLEIAIINAQRAYRGGMNEPDRWALNLWTDHGIGEPATPTEEETRQAQSDLLKARAKYVLRNNVIDSVMIANPTLKAVHNGTDASPVER